MVRAIGNGNDSTVEPENGFTPSRATEMLPLVSRIVADMATLTKTINAQREQLKGVDALSDTISHESYRDELRDIRASLEEDEQRLADCFDELAVLGVRPHHPFDGGVDFPATLNRRPVFLCWMLGEDTVVHWHDPDSQPKLRQAIDSQKFGAESLN